MFPALKGRKVVAEGTGGRGEELLVVSAVPYEAGPTLEMLRQKGRAAGYAAAGIGPINAAKSAQKLKTEAAGRRVIYLGSAGTFGDFAKPYLVTVREVLWLPAAERIGLAKYMPKLHPPVRVPVTGLSNLPVKTVLTGTSVSSDDRISPDGPGPCSDLIENMEAYCIVQELLQAAAHLDILFGITNKVGPMGSLQWAENHMNVAKITAEYLGSCL